jgi:pyruvate/2-oxoglutarate dehydrogenase complex dihydrolipoamide acyltransferase (E2) component
VENYDQINTVRKNIVAIENKIKELSKNMADFKSEFDEMSVCLVVKEKKE